MNPAQQLHAAGRSRWIDSISRRMLTSGTLARHIEGRAATGLTTNPTILGRAMAPSSDYDQSLERHLAAGNREPQELVCAPALEHLTDAADLFRPAWDAAGGSDGNVSLEAEHTCMTMRGARAGGARTVSSALHGLVREDPRTRAEFLALAGGRRG